MTMKSLTTIVAAAMLVAGISVASAQNPAGPASGTSSPSNLNEGSATSSQPQSGSQSNSSAQSGETSKSGMEKSAQVTGKSRFCITGASGSVALNCKYASMEACTEDAQPMGRNCQPNPNFGATTGSGAKMK
jgi:hypothetical protein